MDGRRVEIGVVVAALVGLTLFVFAQTSGFGFVSLDDPHYVSDNPRVTSPSADGVIWALTALDRATWQPATWISLMIDGARAGTDPGPYHVTNVALHVANALLLFGLLIYTTGAVRAAGLAALLFAVHPLHVESVAWITERKDVLSTLFWLGAMLAYARYARKPGAGRYAWVVFAFLVGLMAKPMLVSLPLILLLFDYWPLGRWSTASPSGPGGRTRAWWLVVEKIPLVLPALAVSMLTFLAQNRGGALQSLDVLPLRLRVANALVSYCHYLWDMVWPSGLAALYPYPRHGIPAVQVLGAASALIVATALTLLQWRKRPWVPVGWLWYLITLLPVIGLIQIGMQARADRFTYVPLIGPFIIVAWSFVEIAGTVGRGRPVPRRAIAAGLAVGIVVAAAVAARKQTSYWRDSETLYRRALAVTEANARAHNGLGMALDASGDRRGAIASFRQALRIDSTYAEAHANLAAALSLGARYEEALQHFREALRLDPDNAACRTNLATTLLRTGRVDAAMGQFDAAIRLDPDNAAAHNNLGVIHARRGEWPTAVAHFTEVLRIEPANEGARKNLERARRLEERP